MAATDDFYIALDQGGQSTRAIVFDGRGAIHARHACGIETKTDGPRVEIDPDPLVDSFRTVIAGVLEDLGSDARRVRQVGLATQRSNVTCWRRDTTETLSPVLSWQDRRAPEYLAGLDEAHVHRVTGLFPNPHYGASKLAWCLEHLEPVKRAAREGTLCFGPMASFLASALTGAPAVADPVNGSRTLLWRLDDRRWDGDLCRHFGIDPAWLPPCVTSRHQFGTLSPSFLPRIAGDEDARGDGAFPLTIVTGDLSAAAFSRGRPVPETLYITLGTGAFMQRVEDDRRITHPRLLNGILWHDGVSGVYSLEGTVNGAGSALSWFAEAFDVEAGKLFEWLDDYDPASGGPLLFLNGVSGLGSPFWDADFESRFIGEGDDRSRAFAVVESVVFLLMKNYETMADVIAPPRRIVVNGGLSAVNGLCRALAALTGTPVERSAEPEGTSKGLAYLLAGMPGDWSVRDGVPFEPENCVGLGARYERWARELASALAT